MHWRCNSRICGRVHVGIVARRMKQDFDHGEAAANTYDYVETHDQNHTVCQVCQC